MKTSFTTTIILALAASAFAGPIEEASITSTIKSSTPTPTPTSTPAGFVNYGSYGAYGSYGSYARAAEAEADIEALLDLAEKIKAKRAGN